MYGVEGESNSRIYTDPKKCLVLGIFGEILPVVKDLVKAKVKRWLLCIAKKSKDQGKCDIGG